MKNNIKLFALFAIVMLTAVGGIFAITSSAKAEGIPAVRVEQPSANIVAQYDGIYFNTSNVYDEFEVGETAHYVTYDDADAAIDNEVIRLTPDSYQAVIKAIDSHKELSGHLKATKLYESIEYELIIDEQE